MFLSSFSFLSPSNSIIVYSFLTIYRQCHFWAVTVVIESFRENNFKSNCNFGLECSRLKVFLSMNIQQKYGGKRECEKQTCGRGHELMNYFLLIATCSTVRVINICIGHSVRWRAVYILSALHDRCQKTVELFGKRWHCLMKLIDSLEAAVAM